MVYLGPHYEDFLNHRYIDKFHLEFLTFTSIISNTKTKLKTSLGTITNQAQIKKQTINK